MTLPFVLILKGAGHRFRHRIAANGAIMMFVAEVPLSKRLLAPARLCAGAGRVFAPSVGGSAEEYQRDRPCIFRSGFRPRNATVARRRARNDKTETTRRQVDFCRSVMMEKAEARNENARILPGWPRFHFLGHCRREGFRAAPCPCLYRDPPRASR